MQEYWESIQYCNELPELLETIDDAIDKNTALGYLVTEEGIDLVTAYIAENPDLLDILGNRTRLASSEDTSGDYLAKCALTISARTNFDVDSPDSMCQDLTTSRTDLPSQTVKDYLEYCESCEGVDFFLVAEEDKVKATYCFAFLLIQSRRSDAPDSTNCFNTLYSDSQKRDTLTNEGVNVCTMSDNDCKDKVKRYIEKNAKPIGIIVFVEVFFMYVILFVTQKAIIIFRDEDDVDDDGADDDEDDE